MLLLLREQQEGSPLWDFQKVLCPSGDCLVKGITFFGTPFRGSNLANLLDTISSFLRLPLNRAHIMSLGIRDEEITAIIDEFKDRVVKAQIPLLCFYERLPEKLGIFKHHVRTRTFLGWYYH